VLLRRRAVLTRGDRSFTLLHRFADMMSAGEEVFPFHHGQIEVSSFCGDWHELLLNGLWGRGKSVVGPGLATRVDIILSVVDHDDDDGGGGRWSSRLICYRYRVTYCAV
jgi:hypothetical protein